MSFDLNFCRQNGTVPSVEDLKQYFARFPSFHVYEVETGGVQFWYQNEATSVYCDFSYSLEDVDEELGQCAVSGLSFNLNYIRPSFFAYETMPLVQRFCEHFHLLVEDVQEEKVGPADASHLIDSWCQHNKRAVGALSQEKDVEMCYLSEGRATEWWRYANIKQKIEDSLTEDIFVPSTMILESPEKRLFTLFVWTKGIAQFFPPCDYVLVQRHRKRLFGVREEVGLVPFEAVIGRIGSYLDEYDRLVGSPKYLRPEKASGVVTAIENFALIPIDLSTYTRVAADGFHDVTLT